MKNREAAIAAIRTCKTREALEDMLAKFEVSEEEAISCLEECMYKPKTYFSAKPITTEDVLEFTKQVFLTGTWQLNTYYDKMGIGTEEKNV